jgi:hypothetical protein
MKGIDLQQSRTQKRTPRELETRMSQFALEKSVKRMEAVYGAIVNRIIE